MFKITLVNGLILLLCIALQTQWIAGQNTSIRKHIRYCQQYKSEVFEKVYTYSALLEGVAEFSWKFDNCKESSPFIVGGSPAKPKEFPHMARLGNIQAGGVMSWFCGGTLISKTYVMTAAHCFHSVRGELNIVRLGELNFNSTNEDSRPVDYAVDEYFDHPQYNTELFYNDIGLVKLQREVTLSEYVVPACLPINDGDGFSQFYAVGWGATKFVDSDSDHLMKVTLDRFEASQCTSLNSAIPKLVHGLDTATQLCAGSNRAMDTCSGDSGGPLLQFHDNFTCMYYVVGITSAGIGCGIPGMPSLYTRVHHYIDWIEEMVWKN